MPLPKRIQSTRAPLAGTAGGGPAAGGSSPTSLGLHMQKQAQTEWCWAAVSVSVSLFFDSASGWTQCKLVEAEKNQPTCCQDGSSDPCNKPHSLDDPLRRTGNLLNFTSGAFGFEDTAKEIVNRQAPLGCRVRWDSLTGHFVVIDGISDQGGIQSVDVQDPDPLYASATHLYNDFANHYRGIGTWSHSYTTQGASAAGGMGPFKHAIARRPSRHSVTN
jgi:hypothetical protein